MPRPVKLWAGAVVAAVALTGCTAEREARLERAPAVSAVSATANPLRCSVPEITAVLQQLFDATSTGDGAAAAETFAADPDFAWFSLAADPTSGRSRGFVSIHDPRKIEPYVQRRSDLHERFRLLEVAVNADVDRRAHAAITLYGTRRGAEFPNRTLFFGGKAEVDCRTNLITVMSLGSPKQPPASACGTGPVVLGRLKACRS